jgi:hypothetical protein
MDGSQPRFEGSSGLLEQEAAEEEHADDEGERDDN